MTHSLLCEMRAAADPSRQPARPLLDELQAVREADGISEATHMRVLRRLGWPDEATLRREGATIEQLAAAIEQHAPESTPVAKRLKSRPSRISRG